MSISGILNVFCSSFLWMFISVKLIIYLPHHLSKMFYQEFLCLSPLLLSFFSLCLANSVCEFFKVQTIGYEENSVNEFIFLLIFLFFFILFRKVKNVWKKKLNAVSLCACLLLHFIIKIRIIIVKRRTNMEWES